MNISYEEIGQVLVTCQAGDTVEAGQVVKLGADGLVAPCGAGEKPCGQAVSVAGDGYAAVQVKGFVTLACGDAGVVPGWVNLTGNGTGGVKKAGTGDKGYEALVMSAGDGRAVVCL